MGKGLAGTALGFAIGSLILGWIPLIGWLIWITGLVLAIVAIIKCKTPEQGKGLAIAAVIIMAASFIITLLLMTIGSLAYFGVLSPQKFLPNSFQMTGGISAGEFSADENGVSLSMVNYQGREIVVERANIRTTMEGGPTCDVTKEIDRAIANGMTFDVSAPECRVNRGEFFRGDVTVTYHYADSAESGSHAATGQVMIRRE